MARMLKNPRHEAFANAVAIGKPQVRAYVEAGYRRDYGNAVRLTRNDKVRRRVTQLRKEHQLRTKRTREEHIEKMTERETKADAKGQYAAAQAVARDISQHNNWITDRKEVTIKQDTLDIDLSLLSPEERADMDGAARAIARLRALKEQQTHGVAGSNGNGVT